MAYDPHCHLGTAEARRFAEIPISGVAEISGGYEEPSNPHTNIDGDSRRYSQHVQIASDIKLEVADDSGLTTDIDKINECILEATLSGVIDPALATVVEEINNLTWVAEASAGSSRNAPVWRVKQIESIDQGYYNSEIITWASGDSAFNYTAAFPLSSNF